MRKYLRRKPSAPLVISMLALVIAASGTAVAASNLVSGDSLIKKHSLSGNRLKNNTLTGSQINLKKLGTVPNANHANIADSANTANSASSATLAANAANATTAANATNATNLAGFSRFRTTIASAGTSVATANTVTLGTSGPLTVYGSCWVTGGTTTNAEVDMSTTAAAHYTAYAHTTDSTLAPGSPVVVSQHGVSAGSGTVDQNNPDDGTFSAITDDGGAAILGLITDAVNENGGTGCTFAGFTVSS